MCDICWIENFESFSKFPRFPCTVYIKIYTPCGSHSRGQKQISYCMQILSSYSTEPQNSELIHCSHSYPPYFQFIVHEFCLHKFEFVYSFHIESGIIDIHFENLDSIYKIYDFHQVVQSIRYNRIKLLKLFD